MMIIKASVINILKNLFHLMHIKTVQEENILILVVIIIVHHLKLAILLIETVILFPINRLQVLIVINLLFLP